MDPDEAGPGATASSVAYDGPGQVVVVQGERVLVRRRLRVEPGYAYDYAWLSGPNTGYGFGLSGPGEKTVEDHVVSIREFLVHVDPETGYLA